MSIAWLGLRIPAIILPIQFKTANPLFLATAATSVGLAASAIQNDLGKTRAQLS